LPVGEAAGSKIWEKMGGRRKFKGLFSYVEKQGKGERKTLMIIKENIKGKRFLERSLERVKVKKKFSHLTEEKREKTW